MYRKETSGFIVLVEPDEKCESHTAANCLAKCQGVKEVHLTSGSYGIIVQGKDASDLHKIMAKARKYGKAANFAVKHLTYRKA